MKHTQQFLKRLILILLSSALVSLSTITSVNADDTDIYLTASSVARDDAPNVMLIFDTSGSMSNTVSTRPAFDSSVDYCTLAGNPGITCDRIYYSFSGSPPSTGSDDWFVNTKNKCEDSPSVLSNNGFYSSTKIVGLKLTGSSSSKGWKSVRNQDDSDLGYVDCQADDGATDALGYVKANGNSTSNAYTSNSGLEFNWTNFSTYATPTLYSAQYMNYWHNATLTANISRLQIAKDAMKAVIDANRSVRFGLMAFNQNNNDSTGPHGGRVLMKIDTMDDARRTTMKNTIDGLTALTDHWTPLAETMWEARQYFGGLAVDYGDDDGSSTPARDATAETGSPLTYISPFAFGCQKAYVVYMTDGDPTKDTHADSSSRIGGLSGIGSCDSSDTSTNCLEDVAEWMNTNDVYGGLAGNQTVSTFTIGFGTGISAEGEALLTRTANVGGGAYYPADNADNLSSAFQSALTTIIQSNSSFSSPSLSVNAFNRLFNRDDLYFALFKPSPSLMWDGNVKKFRLCNTADVTSYGCTFGQVIDKDGVPAIDLNNKIKDTATSFWGTVADGANVTIGGAGGQISAPGSRNVYTYLGTYAGLNSSSPATPFAIDAVAGNTLYDAAVTDPTILGLPGTAVAADVAALIDWMRGTDSYDEDSDASTTTHWQFADPLHSRPVAVTFGAELDASSNPDPNKPIIKLFAGTNDGVVRMISNNTGAEEWAFMPKEMLDQQNNLATGPNGNHIYGLDVTPTFYQIDVDNDGVIEPADGDKVYMYIAMRRGGNNIYAFDATPSSKMTLPTHTVTPKLMWVIQGGPSGDADFTKLGQTWSQPVIARVRFKCTGSVCDDGNPTTNDSASRMALLFAGGYDTNQDNAIPAGGDSIGNAIYIVDPLTGARIWWASDTGATLNLTDMVFSIPSELTVLDTDADQSVDRIYVGDTGGQLWRIDLGDQLDTDDSGGTEAYKFADVGCTAGTRADTPTDCSGTALQDRRKFFYPPDVAPVEDPNFSTVSTYDLVTIVSGDRADPLDLLATNATGGPFEAVHNRIYAFRDIKYAKGPPPENVDADTTNNIQPIADADLYDATANNLGTLTGTALTTEITDNVKDTKGWFIDLKESSSLTLPNGLTTKWVGEKGLAKTVIFGGVLFVTTFTPANDTTAATTCAASEGQGTVYAIDYLSGVPEFDYDGDGDLEREYDVGGGIPSEAVIVIREGGVTGLVGTSGGSGSTPVPPGGNRYKTFWYEE